MGSQVSGLQVPSGKAIAAFTPCVRTLQIPNLGEGITLGGLETQLDGKHFLKRPGPHLHVVQSEVQGEEKQHESISLYFL